MKYLFYIGPPAAAFSGDIMRALAAMDHEAEFYAVCSYNEREVRRVEKQLGRPLDGWWLAMPKQVEWIETPTDAEAHAAFVKSYGQEAFARTLAADRFIAKGYVSGGVVKPHPAIDTALAKIPMGATNYVMGLYRFMEDITDRVQPDIAFSYVVANSLAYSIAEVARAHGAQFIQLKPARIDQRYLCDTSVEDRYDPVWQRQKEQRSQPVSETSFAPARNWLKTFRDAHQQPEYHRTNTQAFLARKSWKIYLEAVWHVLRHGTASALGGHVGHRKKAARALARATTEYRSRRDMRFLQDGSIPEGPFVFYPLHVDPEASTMVLAPHHTDQLAVIEALSKALHPGEHLVVKEHLPMVGRRPAGFYDRIARLHNVVLLGPLHNGVTVLSQARVVAVITGTAGWEALCLGIPVLVIGGAPYTPVGVGLTVEHDLSRLSGALETLRSTPPATDEALIRYIQAVFDCSFEMPAKTLFGGYDQVSPDICARAAKDVASHIHTLSQSAL